MQRCPECKRRMIHGPLAALLQHLLFVLLLVVAPIWDYQYTKRLKQNPASEKKIRVYRTLCAWLWASTAVACMALPSHSLFTIQPSPRELPWLQIAWVRYVVEIILALFVVGMLLPIAIAIWKKLTKRPRKYAAAAALKSMAWFLPATWSERRWFAAVAITAGICEEILFRGFLLSYLHVFPLKLSLTLALFAAAAIFGLQHLYQGIAGVVQTAVGGLLFGLLFLLTGTLLLPIILHAITDLRMLVILPPPAAANAATAES